MDSVFVGGAEGFLGRHCVLHYLQAGRQVAGSCWKQALGEELKTWLSGQGAPVKNLHLFAANLSNESEVIRMVKDVHAKLPGLARVTNCAGGFDWVKVTDATREQVEFLLDANFFGNWLLLKHWGPRLQKLGKGRVALISAAASTGSATSGMGLYCASKAALNCVIQAANEEWKDSGVKVGAVYPTIIDTPRNRKDMPTANFSEWMTVAQVVQKMDKLLAD